MSLFQFLQFRVVPFEFQAAELIVFRVNWSFLHSGRLLDGESGSLGLKIGVVRFHLGFLVSGFLEGVKSGFLYRFTVLYTKSPSVGQFLFGVFGQGLVGSEVEALTHCGVKLLQVDFLDLLGEFLI